jgi:hypothetical protein
MLRDVPPRNQDIIKAGAAGYAKADNDRDPFVLRQPTAIPCILPKLAGVAAPDQTILANPEVPTVSKPSFY